jgi:hypothetical protein
MRIAHRHTWLPAIAIIGHLDPIAVGSNVIVEKIDRDIDSGFRLPHGWQNERQYRYRKKYSFHS